MTDLQTVRLNTKVFIKIPVHFHSDRILLAVETFCCYEQKLMNMKYCLVPNNGPPIPITVIITTNITFLLQGLMVANRKDLEFFYHTWIYANWKPLAFCSLPHDILE